jgi:hypothetical protein
MGSSLAWDDTSCSESGSHVSVCRKPIGYFKATNGVFYKIIQKQVTSFAGALAECLADGAALAVPYGAANVRALDAIRVIDVLTGLSGYWVDGTDSAQEGTWTMRDGKSMNLNQSSSSLD